MRKTDYFTRTKCLNKNWTNEEWNEYCKKSWAGPEAYRVAAVYNGFEYNYSDICLNPEVAFEWQGKKGCRIRITLSESPDGWSFGRNTQLGTCGSSHGCPYVERGDRDCYETKDKAYEAAIRAICRDRDYVKRNYGGVPEDDEDREYAAYTKAINSELQKAFRVIDQLEESTKTPSLFGYF